MKVFKPEHSKYKMIRFENIGELNNKSGVYVFVIKDNTSINIDEFESEVTGYLGKLNENYCFDNTPTEFVFTPHFNYNDFEKPSSPSNIIDLYEGRVFYVGKAKNLGSRIREHLNGNKINKTVSLKLGFQSRSKIKEHLSLYYCELSEEKIAEEELRIRNEYGVYFGK